MGHSRNSNRRGKLRAAAGMAAGVFAILGTLAVAGPAAAVAPSGGTPLISGTPKVGTPLTVTNGAWTLGDPLDILTFAHQWQTCSPAAVCTNVGTDAATYTPAATDLGNTIRVVETATNQLSEPSLPATSLATAAVAAADVAPTNTVAPALALSGGAVTGATITLTPGAWSGTPAPTVTTEWQRCDSTGGACVPFTPTTATTYVTVLSDAGFTFRVVESATNAAVTAPVTAATVTTAIFSSLPVNTVAPLLAGEPTIGKPVVVTNGTWTGTPTPTYTYKWQRCAVPTSCLDIVGAPVNAPYTLDLADVGSTVRALVTATNAAGNVSVGSNQTAVVSSGATNFTPTVSVDAQATQPGDSFNVTAPANSTPKVVKPAPKGILQFTPFPVVRLKGVLTTSGARITLLSVTAPKGVSVKVSCSGRGCPRTVALTGTRKSVTRVTGYQRSLRSGVKITVKVFRAGYRGKYTTITIRKGTSPARRDGCLTTSGRPMACQGG